MSIQTDIQSRVDALPTTMRRVAMTIMERPQIVVENTISELARLCDTSDASIVRFCRAIGFTGYPQFKLQLTAELATEAAQFDRGASNSYGADIGRNDTLADMVSKVSGSEILGVRETADNLDLEALERVIRQVGNANRVLLYGVGASNISVEDLAQKLLRIGRTALAFRDAHDALASSALLGPDDVAIGFSHSGRTKETVAFLNAARATGAFTVAVCNAPESPLAEHADALLRTAVRETTFRSGAMASRIAQLTIVDYIFVGVARRQFAETVSALQKTHDVVQELRE